MTGQDPHPSWRALKRLAKALRREFARDGVAHVEYVIAFSDPFDFWVWLGTRSDRDRDILATEPTAGERIRALASAHEVGELYEGFSVESQQTIDREYQGSWFYRLR